jgi:ferredoxin-thioredoxin reductase catalytic subunit
MQQIDMNSDEFQAEMEKTSQFVEKVNRQFGFVQNPNDEVKDGVVMGLARNRMMYGRRFCPCFMVQGDTPEERKEADNRICPCPPALEKEIPEDGLCHCGIFCTPEYAASQKANDEIEEVVHQHSRGLSKDEALILVQKQQLDGDELEDEILFEIALEIVEWCLSRSADKSSSFIGFISPPIKKSY